MFWAAMAFIVLWWGLSYGLLCVLDSVLAFYDATALAS